MTWRQILRPESESFLRVLQQDIDKAERGSTIWFDVLDATSQLAPLIWHLLSDDGRAKFMKDYYSLWCMHRHCMPLVNARPVLAMATAGQLTALSGLSNVSSESCENGFIVTCQTADGQQETTVDFLINATGTGMDIAHHDDPLICQLVRSEQLAPHPLGGVDVDFDTLQLVRSDGSKITTAIFRWATYTRRTFLLEFRRDQSHECHEASRTAQEDNST